MGRNKLPIKEKRMNKAEYMRNTKFRCEACTYSETNHERMKEHIRNIVSIRRFRPEVGFCNELNDKLGNVLDD